MNVSSIEEMEFEELNQFHNNFALPKKFAKELFPEKFPGYLKATEVLGEYSRLRLLSMHPSVDEDLKQEYRNMAERAYHLLPREVKWRLSGEDLALMRDRDFDQMAVEELDAFSKMRDTELIDTYFKDKPKGARDASIRLRHIAMLMVMKDKLPEHQHQAADEFIQMQIDQLPDYAKWRKPDPETPSTSNDAPLTNETL